MVRYQYTTLTDVTKRHKKHILTWSGVIGRPTYLLLASVLFLGGHRHPTLALALFFIAQLLVYGTGALDVLVFCLGNSLTI